MSFQRVCDRCHMLVAPAGSIPQLSAEITVREWSQKRTIDLCDKCTRIVELYIRTGNILTTAPQKG